MPDRAQGRSEAHAWKQRAREFADRHIRTIDAEREWTQDTAARMPWDVIEAGSRAGFRTMAVPPGYGGPNPPMSPLAAALVIEEFAAADPGVASSFNHVIKEVRLIARGASEAQKKLFFEAFMADDRYLTATAMSEPDHGSDRLLKPEGFQYSTTAVRDGDDWILNGRKHCITNGNEARLLLAYANTDPSKDYAEGTTLFMIPREAPGLEPGATHEKIGLRLVNNTEVVFENCRVPASMVLGEVNRGVEAVRGFITENDLLSMAMKLGIARSAYETALEHAKTRVQGGKPIIEHQAVGVKLAEMAAGVNAIRAQMYHLAHMLETPEDHDPSFNELATWHSVEAVFRVATLGVHICGCHGVWLDHKAQKHLRDALVYFPNDGNHSSQLIAFHDRLLAEAKGH